MGLTQTLVLAAESWVVAFSVDRRGFAGADRSPCWSVAGPTLRLASLCRLLSLRNPFMDYNRHFKMYHGAIWAITSTDLRPRRTLSLTLQPSLSNVPLCDLGRNACAQCCAPARRNVWWCPPSQLRAGTPTDWRGSQHVLFALWRDVRCDDRRLAVGSEVLCGESDGVRRRATACDGVRRAS